MVTSLMEYPQVHVVVEPDIQALIPRVDNIPIYWIECLQMERLAAVLTRASVATKYANIRRVLAAPTAT